MPHEAFAVGPAVVGAGHAKIHFFLSRGEVVAADIADIQLAARAVVKRPEGIAQAQRPDVVTVRTGSIVERVVGGDGAVCVDPRILPRGLVNNCAIGGLKCSPVVMYSLPSLPKFNAPPWCSAWAVCGS